jgi:hypothetical protein
VAYETRVQAVRVGRKESRVLVAAFPVRDGEVLFQLTDEGELRRGGVYLLAKGETEARAPRFDELFRDLAAKGGSPRLARSLRPLVRKARTVARATRPRLAPSALARLEELGERGARLAKGHPAAPGIPIDALVLALALVFASEEERYLRPRYRGCDMAFERVMELLETRGKPEARRQKPEARGTSL